MTPRVVAIQRTVLLICGIGLALLNSPAAARRLMFGTLIYLPCLFSLMAVG